MTLIIDNYDSFAWNLAQAFMRLGEEVKVLRNDGIDLDDAEALDFDRLVIAPGPGHPEGAGRCIELIRAFAGRKPILGVGLGHLAIAVAFGAVVARAERVMHGKSDSVEHDGLALFRDLPNPVRVVRYHSLAVSESSLPAGFEVSARSSDGDIMGIRNAARRLEGLQFSPESAGTEEGQRIIANFLSGAQEAPSIKALLRGLSSRRDMTRSEARSLMDRIAEGVATEAQVGALLAAMTVKGPTVEELTGFALSLRERAVPLPLPPGTRLTDTCGTGGDNSGSFNISTAAAFVAAGAGARIAKHGNRSVTSRSGSADVLEAMGVSTRMSPAAAAAAIKEAGMAFLFAPAYHPAFKNIGSARRELGFRTLFNMIGPLLNPARASSQVVGVYASELTETVAAVLAELGVEEALVVHGHDGIDEISLAEATKVTQLRQGWTRTWTLDPAEYGFEPCARSDLKGGEARANARIIEGILDGEPGPRRDVVVLNAAAAILVSGLEADYRRAIGSAQASIDSGRAAAVLASLRRLSGKAG